MKAALVVAVLAGCGAGASRAGPDAAADVETETGGAGSKGGCFPFCPVFDADTPVPDADTDGAMSCFALKASYESLESMARTCNPQIPDSCITTEDPCCAVAVNGADADAVNAFAEAVASYDDTCAPDCSLRICQAPAGTCIATGATTGVCM